MLTKQNIMLVGILVAVYYLYMMNRGTMNGSSSNGDATMA